jgi:hypothetical protein
MHIFRFSVFVLVLAGARRVAFTAPAANLATLCVGAQPGCYVISSIPPE